MFYRYVIKVYLKFYRVYTYFKYQFNQLIRKENLPIYTQYNPCRTLYL